MSNKILLSEASEEEIADELSTRLGVEEIFYLFLPHDYEDVSEYINYFAKAVLRKMF